MPTDRELIEIMTVFNGAGVDQAKASFLGLNGSTLALTATLGLLVAASKSAMDIAKKNEEAHKALAQAVHIQRGSVQLLQEQLDAWIGKNRQYISDSYDTEKALAAIVRAGYRGKIMWNELSLALDIAVIRHTSVSDAAALVVKVLAGSPKVLKEVGITTAQYTAIMKSHHTQAWKNAAILTLLNKHYAEGRKTQDEVKQATNSLGITWERFAAGPGKQFNDALSAGTGILDLFLQFLMKMGSNNAIWDAIQGRLIDFGNWIHDHIVKPFQDAQGAIPSWLKPLVGIGVGNTQQAAANVGFAANPSGGGGRPVQTASVQVNINGGMFMDHGPTVDALTNAIAQRVAQTRGL